MGRVLGGMGVGVNVVNIIDTCFNHEHILLLVGILLVTSNSAPEGQGRSN